MANHKSALKRIRRNEKVRLHNKYYHKTMRTLVRRFRALSDKQEAEKLFPTVVSAIDRLAKINVIHKNKAGNLKSSLTLHLNKL